MNNTGTVKIPKGYFFKQSKQEYSDYATRLVQEVLQNSIDAKATEIRLNFCNGYYIVQDNGKGMNKETMINGLLTFGGSEKDEDSTGGFGYAKVLILFAMDMYEIHSRNIKAEGEGLNYTMDENAEYFHGTKIVGLLPNEWGCDANEMGRKTRILLRKSHIQAKVFIDDVEFTDWNITSRCTRKNEWSKLYSTKSEYDQYYLNVRKNGLFMFEKYLGSAIKKNIILEITAPSTQVLNSNRDGFKSQYDDEFSKLFAEIAIDKNSFDRAKGQRINFAGIKGFDFIKFKEEIKEFFLPSSSNEYMDVVVNALITSDVAKLEEIKEHIKTVNPLQFIQAEGIINAAIEHVEKHRGHDFVIDLGDSGYTEIPKRFHPNTMATVNKTVAQQWKSCLLEVMKANKLDTKFRIGFVLESNIIAQFKRNEEIEEYLINPDAEFLSLPKWLMIMKMLATAAHEITHRYYSYHDENFVSMSENLLTTTLAAIKGDANVITKNATHIEI